MPAQPNPPSRLAQTNHPVVYEVNVRVLLNELTESEGKRVTLGRIPDRIIDEWADLGFDAVWLMGIWATGSLGKKIASEDPALEDEYRKVLPGLSTNDIIGSPYAVQSYSISRALGGTQSLLSLRKRLARRGLGLILDYVSNHTARDHEWVSKHPEYYVQVREDKSSVEGLQEYFKVRTARGEKLIAFGRDPYFPGWTDTAQLNPYHAGARKAMISTLLEIARLCDGIRCDMAMLVLSQVFEGTWGERALVEGKDRMASEFWSEAIEATREKFPGFMFIAEAYWNLEWQLQQLGFQYTYDKLLYDRLLHEGASSVRNHLKAELNYQLRSVRFIENHDERRAAEGFADESWHFAAATIAATVPGMLLVHDGQLEGRRHKLPVQLGRRPQEVLSQDVAAFYRRLLRCIASKVFKCGAWQLLELRPAWHGNESWQNLLAFWWQFETDARLIVVNYAPHSLQCYVELKVDGIGGSSLEFRDLLGHSIYVRERSGLLSRGMYFDLPSYGVHIFEVVPAQKHSP